MDTNKNDEIRITVQYNKQTINLFISKSESVYSLHKKISQMFYPLSPEAKIFHGDIQLHKEDDRMLEFTFKTMKAANINIYDSDQNPGIKRQATLRSTKTKKFQSSNKIYTISDNNQYTNKISSRSIIQIKRIIINCDCEINQIEVYCRECNKCLCVECMNKTHCKNHKYISIDTANINGSIENYVKSMQQDLNSFKELYGQDLNTKYINDFKSIISEIKEMKLEVNRKIEDFNMKTKIIIEDFENKYNNIADNTVIEDLDVFLSSINDKLNKEKIYTFRDAVENLTNLNQKENLFDKYIKDACNFRPNTEMINTINDLYITVNKSLEATILKVDNINKKITSNNFKIDKERLLSPKKDNRKSSILVIKESKKSLNNTGENDSCIIKLLKSPLMSPNKNKSRQKVNEDLELPMLTLQTNNSQYMRKRTIFNKVATKSIDLNINENVKLISRNIINSPILSPKKKLVSKFNLNRDNKLDPRINKFISLVGKSNEKPIDPTEQLKIRSQRKPIFDY